MIILDIILVLVLVLAAWRGWRQGITVQVFSIAALLLGVWLAFRFASRAGGWIGLPDTPPAAGFALILIAVILLMWLIGRLTRGLFRLSGLKVLDSVGGIVLSVVKTVLILALLAGMFSSLNRSWKMVEPSALAGTCVYPRLEAVSAAVFPYIAGFRDRLLKAAPEPQPEPDVPARSI